MYIFTHTYIDMLLVQTHGKLAIASTLKPNSICLLTKAQNELVARCCLYTIQLDCIRRYNRDQTVEDYMAISFALIQTRSRCSIQFCVILTSRVSTILQLDISVNGGKCTVVNLPVYSLNVDDRRARAR